MDNVGIVVDELGETIDFFRELGLELEGRATIEGEWAGRVTGLADLGCRYTTSAVGDWLGYSPRRIALEEWLTRWTAGVEQDRRAVAVFPVLEANRQRLLRSD
jgi:catechol 2,3-dioxygenase-like lactoylglutathione lyase family enzyme